MKIVIVNEESLMLKRNEAYKGTRHSLSSSLSSLFFRLLFILYSHCLLLNLSIDSHPHLDSTEEKNTRGLIKAAVDRNLTTNTIVICDSLNYIKAPHSLPLSLTVFTCNLSGVKDAS